MIKRLLNSRFVRNVLLVATGTAGAQAITMAFSPIITRLYGPEAYGLLGTFSAVLSIAMPIAALTYPIAIVLPKRDDDARGIAKLSVLLALFICLIVATVLLVGGQPIARLLDLEAISAFLLLIPFAMFLNVLQQIMQQWLIRKKQFKVSARIAISQSLILNISKTGVGFVHPAGASLIILATLGNALYATQLWLGARRWTSPKDYIHKPEHRLPKSKAVAAQHRDFPLFRTPQVTINAFAQGLPVLMLASFFGSSIAGFYTLSRSVMAAPAHLLGSSVGNVFYAQIAEAVNAGKDPRSYLNKATFGALAVAIIPFGIIMIWGSPLFAFIFGEQWHTAGTYAQWVALWLLFSLAARPVIATIPVLDMQGWFLMMEIVFTSLRVAALALGAWVFKDPLYAVAGYTIMSALFYISLYVMVIVRANKRGDLAAENTEELDTEE